MLVTGEKPWKTIMGATARRGFNWVTSKLGLSATFKRARILRYAFASAWQGTYQIENFFDSIVRGLLLSLQANRTEPGEKGRPIIFIGHSMGGLVIAKALTEMDRLRKDFGELLPCVTSCVFFGTPFVGTGMASFFFDVVEIMRRHALKVSGAFWSMMRPESESLQTLRHEVAHLAQRTEPNIELRYVFEQLQFDEREMFPDVSGGNMFERKMDGSFLSFLAGLDETTSLELHKRLEGYLEVRFTKINTLYRIGY
ncbi:hypothetical protein BDP55DRAFT_646529 [Colletotrichum godetiae]|uniref:DUF676 domain-containing protein n=1 Tax=Colletotrichum godetiae TaxID=1209918 RepID=A0AAJ0F389_9PEZI|nr:uncharacterized protein BDP55DRAFT_646529 [Colletotrichum godetiae]KAK1691272.1 hypothetical protein BDP55DRAFT_646529 [Colletotrichum godetiae]